MVSFKILENFNLGRLVVLSISPQNIDLPKCGGCPFKLMP